MRDTYFYNVREKRKPYQNDRELMDRYYKDKDEYWLGLLLEKYFHLMFGVCLGYLKNETEAQDQTQQISLAVLREFRHGKNEIRYFKSWLYQVTKNHCLMHLRKNKHQTLSLENIAGSLPAAPSEKGWKKMKEEQYELLDRALLSLNEEQQSCIRLFYYQRKSYQEIAEEKGLDLKQVKSFIQNGRRNLKIFMEKNLNE